jgi:transcriptional regulator with PAS, ATPase and Fis domain
LESLSAPDRTLTVALDEPLDRIVARVIDAVLAQEQGNRTRTAARLGISVRTVQRHAARSGGTDGRG